MGLRAKLGHMAGGVEKKVESLTELRNKKKNKDKDDIVTIDKIEHTDDPSKIPEGEARIIRDPETNEVLKVIYGTMKAEDEESDEDKVDNSVIKQLEEYAEQHSKVKKERHLSDRESDWLKSLYEKYGDDYEKMKWDKKLNIYQQSAGDLKRRINKWKKGNGL